MASVCVSSCEPAIWNGVAAGLAGLNPYGYSSGYNAPLAGSYTLGSNNNNNNSSASPSSSSSSKRACSMCKGTGRMVKESSVATFGLDEKVKCNECGGTFWRSTGHVHVTCSVCHGNGFFN